MFIAQFIRKAVALFKELLLNENPHTFESAVETINYWDKKKKYIRVLCALWIIFFSLLGIELSTPYYSVTEQAVGFIADNALVYSLISQSTSNNPQAKKIASTQQKMTNQEEVTKAIKQIKLADYIKFCGYAIFLLILIFAFINSDPFSKKHLILNIIDKGKYQKRKKFLHNYRDIFRYAKIAPSNHIYARCEECKHVDHCENCIINSNRYKRIEIWTKMFLNFRVDTINDTMRLVNQCRKWHFVKYSLVLIAIILFTVYSGVRITEYFNTELAVTWNTQLLAVIFSALTIYFITQKMDPSLEQLEVHLSTLYTSPEFSENFKKSVCDRVEPDELYEPKPSSNKSPLDEMKEGYEKEIKKLVTTINFLTSTNNHRIDLLAKTIDSRIRRKPIIENILLSVVLMLKKIHNDAEFTASLLIPEGEILRTWLTRTSYDLTLRDNPTIFEIDRVDVFGIQGSSVASKSWKHNAPLSSNTNIAYIYENQEENIRSIIAIPIECQEGLYLRANNDIYKIDKVVAILCIACTNPSIFTTKNCEINSTVLNPYASMINLQYSLRVIDRIIKGC